MVHNGIEYGDMQLIGEAYTVLKLVGGLTNDELAAVFADWNKVRGTAAFSSGCDAGDGARPSGQSQQIMDADTLRSRKAVAHSYDSEAVEDTN